MRLTIFLLLLSALPAFAAESLTFKLKDGTQASVTLVEAKETARLRLDLPGSEPFTTEILGEEFQEFEGNGKATLLAAEDLDGDGNPELFARTTLPPKSGQFFAFRVEGSKLTPLHFGKESFLEVSHGGSVRLSKGKVEFEDFANEEHPVRRTVRFSGQAFTPLLR